ncbi:hypothetical protein KY330_03400 [Candidatus Woesearchaeota archaeon]|nr:hypothetical protein [Candidatus Woesearchaeota archaeon]
MRKRLMLGLCIFILIVLASQGFGAYTKVEIRNKTIENIVNVTYCAGENQNYNDAGVCDIDNIVLRVHTDDATNDSLNDSLHRIGLLYSDKDAINYISLTSDVGGELVPFYAPYGETIQGSSGNWYRDIDVTLDTEKSRYPAFLTAVISDDYAIDAGDTLVPMASVDGWFVGGMGNESDTVIPEQQTSTECCWFGDHWMNATTDPGLCGFDSVPGTWSALGCNADEWCYNETTLEHCSIDITPAETIYGHPDNWANQSYNLTVAGGKGHVNVTVENAYYVLDDLTTYTEITHDANYIVIDVRTTGDTSLDSTTTSLDNLATLSTGAYDGTVKIYANGIEIQESVVTSSVAAPTVTLLSPVNATLFNYSSMTFVFNVSDDYNVTNCSIYYNQSGGWVENETLVDNEIFDNDVNNVTASFADGAYLWNVLCYDNDSLTDTYEENWTFAVDTVYTTISIVNPVNESNLSASTTQTFINITTDEVAYCKYHLSNADFNFATEGASFTNTNSYEHSFTYGGLSAGNVYTLYYKCNDTTGNINQFSTVHLFAINVTPDTPPSWSSNRTDPESGVTFSLPQSYQFNITWTDDISLSDVIFNIDGTNYTNNTGQITMLGSEYYITLYNLTATTHTYQWLANDSGGNWNYTGPLTYDIIAATSTCSLNFFPTSPVTYPQSVNASCSCTNTDDEVVVQLWRNNSMVSNNVNVTIWASLYNYTCNSTATGNYSVGSTSDTFLIQKATGQVDLLLNSSSADFYINDSEYVNITGLLVAGEEVIYIYENGTQINSGVSPLINITNYSTGVYNISAVYFSTQNYTADIATHNIYVAADTFNPSVYDLEAAPSTINQGDTTNLTVNVSDNSALSFVIVEIEYSNGSKFNDTMTQGSGNAWYYPYTTTSSNPAGTYSVRIFANDTNNNINNTETTTFDVNDVTYPAVTDPQPTAGTNYNQYETINLNVTVTDETSVDKVYANITWDGGLYELVELTDPNSDTLFTAVFTTTTWLGQYNLTILANDTSGNLNDTQTTYFIINDISAPAYSNILEQPSSPATYSPGQFYQFNSTWVDDGILADVILEFDGQNYSYLAGEITKTGDLYNVTFVDLGVGVYDYRWFANDSAGNYNSTAPHTYTISAIQTSCYLTLFPDSPVTYPQSVNASCVCDSGEATGRLWRNETEITGTDMNLNVTLAASLYNFVCNVTDTGNYTSASNISSYTVAKATGQVDLLLNGTSADFDINESEYVNITGLLISGEDVFYVYENGTQINSGISPLINITNYTAGVYNISAVFYGTQNYTADIVTHNINVAVDNINPVVTDLLAAPATINQGDTVNITLNSTDLSGLGQMLVEIEYPNATKFNYSLTSGAGDSWYYEFVSTSLTPAGTYNVRIFAFDSNNNVNNSETTSFDVNDVTYPVVTDPQPTTGTNYNQYETIDLNVTVTDETGITNVYANITWDGGLYELVELTDPNSDTLFTGSFSTTTWPGQYNVTILANDTSGNLNDTQTTYFTISDISAPAYSNILEQPSSPVTYVPGQFYQFNSTWVDDASLADIILEFDGQNYSYLAGEITKTGDVYNVTLVDLGVGVYDYRWFANDSAGNFNSTAPATYTINAVQTSCYLTLFPDSPVTYPQSVNASCVCDSGEATGRLWRNTTEITGTDMNLNVTLAASLYNFVCNVTDTGNYTSASNTSSYTVAKATGQVDLLLNGTSADFDINESEYVNITGLLVSGDGIIYLYENGTQINSGASPLINISNYSAGVYNLSVVYFPTQNYTADIVTHNINVAIDNINPVVTDLLAAPATINQGDTVNVTLNATDLSGLGQMFVEIEYPNATKFNYSLTSGVGNNWYYEFVSSSSTPAGTYDVRIFAFDSKGNVNNSETTTFDVNDVTYPVVTDPQPTAGTDYNQADVINLNVSVSDETEISDVIANVSWDGVYELVYLTDPDLDGVYTATFTNTTMPATYNIQILANDSTGNLNDTQTTSFNINDVTNPAVGEINPTTGTSYNLTDTVFITANVSDPYYNNLDKVYANLSYDSIYSIYEMTYSSETELYEFNFTNTTWVGTYTITIVANDSAGNTNDTQTSSFNAGDSLVPVVTLVSPVNDTNSTNPSQSFTFNVTDNYYSTTSCVLYIDSVDSGTNSSVLNATDTIILNNTVPEQFNYWYVQCTDGASNVGTSETRILRIDYSAPTITIERPSQDSIVGFSLVIDADVGDNVVGVDRTWYEVYNSSGNVKTGFLDGAGYTDVWDTSAVLDGNYSIIVHANDTLGNYDNTTNNFTIDNTKPFIQIFTPENNSLINSDFNLNVSVQNYKLNLSWYNITNLAGTSVQSGVDSGINAASYQWLNSVSLGSDNYTLTVYAMDSVGYNTTLVHRFTIDRDAPYYTSLNTYPTSPYTFTVPQNYQFNITVGDGISLNDTVLQFDGINYTYSLSELSILGSEYYKTFTNLSVGTYYYRWFMNDSAGNYNFTSLQSFVVSQYPSSCYLTLFPPPTTVYPQTVNASCSCDNQEATGRLWRNDTEITGSEMDTNVTLAAGAYYYTCNVTDTGNYSSTTNSTLYTINKATGQVSLLLNGTSADFDINDSEYVNINGSLILGEDIIYVYENGTQIDSGAGPLINDKNYSAGVYNISVVYYETQNYTADIETHNINVAVDTINPAVTDFLAYPSAVNQGDTVNVTLNATDLSGLGQMLVEIEYPNATKFNYSLTSGVGDSWYYEFVSTSLTPAGTYNVRIFAFDSNNNVNNTETTTFDVNDITYPLVTDPQPTAGTSYNQYETINLNVTVTDETDVSSVYANITWNGGVYELIELADPNADNIYTITFTNTTFPTQYNITIIANDTSGNLNDTQTTYFIINDISAPAYSNINELLLSPVVYSPGQVYEFNATWVDLYGMSDVVFEFDGQNYSYLAGELTKVGDVYNFTFVDLGVGVYDYRWFANDSVGNYNFTGEFTYTITAVQTSCYLTLFPDSPVTYNQSVNASCLCDSGEASGRLWRNTTEITGTDMNLNVTLAASLYNFVCNVTDTGNYSSASNSSSYTVAKATGQVDLLLNGTSADFDINESEFVNITGLLLSGEDIIYVYENGTQIDSGAGPLINDKNYSAGVYNISVVYFGSQNYTADIVTHNINVAVDTTNPSVKDILVYPTPINQGDTTNITLNASDVSGLSSVIVEIEYSNGSKFNETMISGVGDTWYYTYTTTSSNPAGTYNVRIFASDPRGNLNNTETSSFVINDISYPAVSGVSPSAATYAQAVSVPISVTVTDETGISKVYANITWDGGVYEVIELTDPNLDGVYTNTFTNTTYPTQYNITIIANDTNGNLNDTQSSYFTINDIEAPSVADLIPAAGTSYNLGDLVQLSVNVTDPYHNNLDKVFANISYDSVIELVEMIYSSNTGLYYANFTNTSIIGTYNVQILANDSAGNLNSLITTYFNVADILAPTVSLTSPANDTDSTSSTVSFVFYVIDNYASTLDCKLYVNNDIAGQNATTLNNTATTIVDSNVPEGDVYWYVNCTDGSSNFNVSETRYIKTDYTPPSFTFTNITPRIVVNGDDVFLNASASDNVAVGQIWAVIGLPNGSSVTKYLSQNDNNYTTNITGWYNVTFYANDTQSNIATLESFFEVAEEFYFNLTIVDFSLNGVPVTATFYYPNSTEVIRVESFTGNASIRLANSTYDMVVEAFDGSIVVHVIGIELNQNNPNEFGMDRLSTPAPGFLVTYGLNNTFLGIFGANITLNYTGLNYSYENTLEVYKCDNWDFTGQTCLSSWVLIASDQNLSANTLIVNVTSFSGFSIKQGSYCGDGTCDANEDCNTCSQDCGVCPSVTPPRRGGGPGGCFAHWNCTDWSPCGPNGWQERTCVDVSGCYEESKFGLVKPVERRDCKYEVSCDNLIKDDGETDIDCGGPCTPCDLGQSCSINADCVGVCNIEKICVNPGRCDNRYLDNNEDGVDCGGPCKACIEVPEVVPPVIPPVEVPFKIPITVYIVSLGAVLIALLIFLITRPFTKLLWLIYRCYRLLRKGRLEEAIEIRNLINSAYAKVKKNKVKYLKKIELLDTSIKYVINTHKFINQAENYLSKDDYAAASKIYNKIRAVYDKMPKKAKRLVYKDIMSLYKQVNKKV